MIIDISTHAQGNINHVTRIANLSKKIQLEDFLLYSEIHAENTHPLHIVICKKIACSFLYLYISHYPKVILYSSFACYN